MSALYHRGRLVARSVVDKHHFVALRRRRLFETRIQHALEQMRAVVGAQLNRRLHSGSPFDAAGAETSERAAATIRSTSRCSMQA